MMPFGFDGHCLDNGAVHSAQILRVFAHDGAQVGGMLIAQTQQQSPLGCKSDRIESYGLTAGHIHQPHELRSCLLIIKMMPFGFDGHCLDNGAVHSAQILRVFAHDGAQVGGMLIAQTQQQSPLGCKV